MGRRLKQVDKKLSYEFDRRLLELLKKGRPSISPSTGLAVLDDNGEPVYTPASAADLSVIRGRLRDCGATESDGLDEDNPVDAAMKRMEAARRTGRGDDAPLRFADVADA